MNGCSWQLYLINLWHYNSREWIKGRDDNCVHAFIKQMNLRTIERQNHWEPIELERRRQTVMEFASLEYVNAFLEHVSIGNYTSQTKSKCANVLYMYVDQIYANAWSYWTLKEIKFGYKCSREWIKQDQNDGSGMFMQNNWKSKRKSKWKRRILIK